MGRVTLDPGWKAVYSTDSAKEPDEKSSASGTKEEESGSIPTFRKGEEGPHKPFLAKKTTQPPKYYTEGTLLKAMETAGSQVDDEELREALKANGIGRPSTRASIIETLFKRGYIRRERKSLRATQAGIDIIGIIKEELLKSAKLTGQWERKLRMIESGDYKAEDFIGEIKKMINDITISVLSDNTNRHISTNIPDSKPEKARKTLSKKDSKKD